MSAGIAFKNFLSRAWLWCPFQNVVKSFIILAYLFFIKPADMLMGQFFIALFLIYVQSVYDLKI